MSSKELKKPESIIEDENNNIFEECPACGSLLGCQEFDFQYCRCCGYPDCEKDCEDDDNEWEDEEEWWEDLWQ